MFFSIARQKPLHRRRRATAASLYAHPPWRSSVTPNGSIGNGCRLAQTGSPGKPCRVTQNGSRCKPYRVTQNGLHGNRCWVAQNVPRCKACRLGQSVPLGAGYPTIPAKQLKTSHSATVALWKSEPPRERNGSWNCCNRVGAMLEQEENGAAAEAEPQGKHEDAPVVRKAKRAARWQRLRMQQLVRPVGQEP